MKKGYENNNVVPIGKGVKSSMTFIPHADRVEFDSQFSIHKVGAINLASNMQPYLEFKRAERRANNLTKLQELNARLLTKKMSSVTTQKGEEV
tara:strand:- start:75 stop:353 length:279 start_codon:yes stop_codon:yes gene_type:complete